MTVGHVKAVMNAVDDFWGLLLRGQTLSSATGVYRVEVYDAFRLTFTPASNDSVHVRLEGLAPEPRQFDDQTVRVAEVPALLERTDGILRALLPPAYLEAVIAEARRMGADIASDRAQPPTGAGHLARVRAQQPENPEPPGPKITLEDVPGILTEQFGDRITRIATGEDGHDVEGMLDHRLRISVGHEHQYGAFHAAIILAPQAFVLRVFGSRLIARHADARSIRELLDLIDYWYQLRLGGDPPLPAGLPRMQS